ncbi:MAG: single-stranded-DNA-specific exonuclease RecJ [bacterium]
MNSIEIAEKFKLHKITSNILWERGYKEEEEIRNFLNPSREHLISPSNLNNLNTAINEIKASIEFDDNITIFTDYDVDGITSGAIMYKSLKRAGAKNVFSHVGNRYKDGYGLSKESISEMNKENNTDLLITVDCGINEKNNVEYAKELGMKVIVIDHHEPKKGCMPHCTCIDPKVGSYPFKHLSACGVTWKVCQELLKEPLYEYLDIVALSTVADVVDLVGENRFIVKEGLKRLSNTKNLGLQQMIKQNKRTKNKELLTTGDVGFQIAPAINAMGRLGHAKICFELLITDNEERAEEIVKMLYKNNKKRQRISKEALEDAESRINHSDNIIILKGDYQQGILGLVAGDLKEKYKKPTILIDKSSGKGSCRSVSPLKINKLLEKNEKYLKNYGGHAYACGLEIKKGEFENFKNDLIQQTKEITYDELDYDVYASTEELSIDLVDDLNKLAPFGKGNPRPKIKSVVNLKSVKSVGKNNEHLKFIFDKGLSGIGFFLAGHSNKCKEKILDITYYPDINDYWGKKELQLNVKEIRNLDIPF